MRGIKNTKGIRIMRRHNRTDYQVRHKGKVLGTGKTLIEALVKQDWCKANKWKKYSGGLRYISKEKNHYCIYKNNKHYGSFKTLTACMAERDCLVKYDWDYDLMVECE